MRALRWPKKAPTNVRGREMPSHITTKAKKVPKGMALEEFFDHTNMFNKNTKVIKNPGTSVAVTIAFLVHDVPLNTLYKRAE
jgi:hypothetical protein